MGVAKTEVKTLVHGTVNGTVVGGAEIGHRRCRTEHADVRQLFVEVSYSVHSFDGDGKIAPDDVHGSKVRARYSLQGMQNFFGRGGHAAGGGGGAWRGECWIKRSMMNDPGS